MGLSLENTYKILDKILDKMKETWGLFLAIPLYNRIASLSQKWSMTLCNKNSLGK